MADEIDEFIVREVGQSQLGSVAELVGVIEKRFNISEERAMEKILNLQRRGVLKFREPLHRPSAENSLFSPENAWYWIVLSWALISVALTFTIREGMFPLVYLRYVFGSAFVFFLPGFCLLKALFPGKKPNEVETIALSIGTSFAVVLLLAFLFNFTPWGVNAATISISVLMFIVVFAAAGVIMERRIQVS